MNLFALPHFTKYFCETLIKEYTMALINCPECGKEISEKAASCPLCGYPMKQAVVSMDKDLYCPECGKEVNDNSTKCPLCDSPLQPVTHKVDLSVKRAPVCPGLPDNMSIGSQIINWKLDAALDCYYDWRMNDIREIPNGKAQCLLHRHGIRVTAGFNLYDINNAQIISISTFSDIELRKEEKSIIGRAVIGGLLLGNVGAIIGGMTGLGTIEKMIQVYHMAINFWNRYTLKAETMILSCDTPGTIELFLSRREKEL